ncbi:MAG TPA: hypothetical protein DCQ98_10640 [Planctomycetaceae bacterium]|nr:hypothetical protein [Planctomycetaceae bacterium]
MPSENGLRQGPDRSVAFRCPSRRRCEAAAETQPVASIRSDRSENDERFGKEVRRKSAKP